MKGAAAKIRELYDGKVVAAMTLIFSEENFPVRLYFRARAVCATSGLAGTSGKFHSRFLGRF
jgi:hypothetical protein